MSTEAITIAGFTFQVPVRYEEGHELTAGEASALNQTFHENLRNNFAKRVKDAGDEPDLDVLQRELDEYAEGYEFGVRAGGGRTTDPVLAEAMLIAKNKIRDALRRKGVKQKDVQAQAITDKARFLIERDPRIMELARERVRQAQAAASEDLDDLIGDLGNGEQEQAAE